MQRDYMGMSNRDAVDYLVVLAFLPAYLCRYATAVYGPTISHRYRDGKGAEQSENAENAESAEGQGGRTMVRPYNVGEEERVGGG